MTTQSPTQKVIKTASAPGAIRILVACGSALQIQNGIAFRQEGNDVNFTGLPQEWPDTMPVSGRDLDGPPVGVSNPLECGLSRIVI